MPKTKIRTNDEDRVEAVLKEWKLTKEDKEIAANMSTEELRMILDTYEQSVNRSTRAKLQQSAIKRNTDTGTTALLKKIENDEKFRMDQLKVLLGIWVRQHPMYDWLVGVKGVGPVISAAILSHFEIDKAPTCGHFWNFAGMNPDKVWEEGKKRPWNAYLKSKLLHDLGKGFVKLKNNEGSFYSQLYIQRKAVEVANNDSGLNSETARKTKILKEPETETEKRKRRRNNIKAYTPDTDAAKWILGKYPAGANAGCIEAGNIAAEQVMEAAEKAGELDVPGGRAKAKAKAAKANLEARKGYLAAVEVEAGKGLPMIPPANVDARAVRWVVKLFVSHLHAEWFKRRYNKEAPKPYAIEHEGHAHIIADPQAFDRWIKS